MNHQERTIKNVITANPPPSPPQKTPQTMNKESNIKLILMLHNIKVETCTKDKDVQIIRAPRPPCNQKHGPGLWIFDLGILHLGLAVFWV